MDPGRYGLQQGWDNNSALEGYTAANDSKYRFNESYDERFPDERYLRDNIHQRNTYHGEILERDIYPPPPHTVDAWPQSRRRNYEDYPPAKESRRPEKPYIDSYHGMDNYRGVEPQIKDGYQSIDSYHQDYGFDRSSRSERREREDYANDDYDYRSRSSHHSREDSRERDYDPSRYSYDSDYERGSRRDTNWRRRDSRDRGSRDREWDKRCLSRERVQSPLRRDERSRSRARDDVSRSRSPRGRSRGRSHREDSYDDDRYDRTDKRRGRDEKYQQYQRDYYSAVPSPTVVVKGLSLKTTEEELYQTLAEWGPLRHVRVIKERNSGVSRGFAFIDFPSVVAARAMIDSLGEDGLVMDGRKLFFEYSSKPTSVGGGSYGHENATRPGHGNQKSIIMSSDWMCTICSCVNFARRTSCFQCNEPRTEDAPPADIALSNSISMGKRGSETGPSHVLVVRGLDENADEDMLRYEFSKHAPIKDLRLVRDKFTHVSRGFAFVHFHSVGDATKTLQVTNGTALEKNGQILRVAYAKSVLGPASGTPGSSHSSSLAAAAIEAAAFSQQYDAVGWAPKEYNPDDKESIGGQNPGSEQVTSQKDESMLQSGFVWDEASGYYYDAASKFYYDGNTGLYYDSNNGMWYSYDQQAQQYVPCADQNNDNKTPGSSKTDGSNNKKIVISAPAATVMSVEKVTSLPDAVQAAAAAAIAAEKKEKEKAKEIKLASKSSILANKKKMSNVLMQWKQRSHEGQATRVALDDNQSIASAEDRSFSAGLSVKSKFKPDVKNTKEHTAPISGVTTQIGTTQPISNSSGVTLMGVIRSSGRGAMRSDASTATASAKGLSSFTVSDTPATMTPFKTDASALGVYSAPVVSGSGRRRFSELPLPSSNQKEQTQNSYRDRAAERRSLYGSSSSIADNLQDAGFGDSNRDIGIRKGSLDPMPFPPGVGGERGIPADNIQSYEVITADKAIDESNVGNRMLRNMGWHEGSGLGRDGSGMVEPVVAQSSERRAGLGSQQKKQLDPSLEVQAGDSYKTLIHKKALARFQEMNE